PSGAPNKAVKPEAIPAILNDLNSSPLSRMNFPIQVPVEPVTCTKGASGPKLPPEAIHNIEDKSIDGLFFGYNLHLLNRILFTIRSISPGFPIKCITNPARSPHIAITGMTCHPEKKAISCDNNSRINQ